MKYTFMLLLIAFSLISATNAQTMLRGRVIDASNNTPLTGATIKAGDNSITTTDQNGTFSIPCGNATRITISYVGYETADKTIKTCSEELTISLTSFINKLNEVEISATSNQNRSLLYQPVSISKLQPLELKRGLGLFMDDAINTNVPGVTMQRRAVASGQQFNIRGYGNGVRGTNGLNSNFDGQGYKVYLNGIPVT